MASDTTMNLKTANGQDVTSALRLLKDRNAGFKVTYNYVDDDGKPQRTRFLFLQSSILKIGNILLMMLP